MKVSKIFLYLILALALSSVSFAQSYNYEEMEMDEYNALLQEWQGRLDAANQGIAAEDTERIRQIVRDRVCRQRDAFLVRFEPGGNVIAAVRGGGGKRRQQHAEDGIGSLQHDPVVAHRSHLHPVLAPTVIDFQQQITFQQLVSVVVQLDLQPDRAACSGSQ